MTANVRPPASMLASESWPATDLETVEACPVCGTKERQLLHEGLWDNVFFVAPGRWQMWSCQGCRSGYLDPRPTRQSIGRAYERYYTHTPGWTSPPPRSFAEKVRAAAKNAYPNWRYGTGRRPSIPLGPLSMLLPSGAKVPIDIQMRYLPRPNGRSRPKVLDVGCGGPEWLKLAEEAGWEAVGADADPIVCGRARDAGYEVREGGAEAWLDATGTFDALTASHVIEHLHDPVESLGEMFQLLKPGGTLFLETPNVDAAGHAAYGPNWRGLEPPRHLVLFNLASLEAALLRSGYRNIRTRARPSPAEWMGLSSARAAAGADPNDDDFYPCVSWPQPGTVATASEAEFLTMTCEKP